MRVPVHQPELYPVEEWNDGVDDTGTTWRWHHHAADLPLPPAMELAEAQAQVDHLTTTGRDLADEWVRRSAHGFAQPGSTAHHVAVATVSAANELRRALDGA